MKVYITKYALTCGIYSADAELSNGGSTASYRFASDHFQQYSHGNDFQISEDLAIKRAEIMRLKKIESLKKQIAKLESMKFKIVEMT